MCLFVRGGGMASGPARGHSTRARSSPLPPLPVLVLQSAGSLTRAVACWALLMGRACRICPLTHHSPPRGLWSPAWRCVCWGGGGRSTPLSLLIPSSCVSVRERQVMKGPQGRWGPGGDVAGDAPENGVERGSPEGRRRGQRGGHVGWPSLCQQAQGSPLPPPASLGRTGPPWLELFRAGAEEMGQVWSPSSPMGATCSEREGGCRGGCRDSPPPSPSFGARQLQGWRNSLGAAAAAAVSRLRGRPEDEAETLRRCEGRGGEQ